MAARLALLGESKEGMSPEIRKYAWSIRVLPPPKSFSWGYKTKGPSSLMRAKSRSSQECRTRSLLLILVLAWELLTAWVAREKTLAAAAISMAPMATATIISVRVKADCRLWAVGCGWEEIVLDREFRIFCFLPRALGLFSYGKYSMVWKTLIDGDFGL